MSETKEVKATLQEDNGGVEKKEVVSKKGSTSKAKTEDKKSGKKEKSDKKSSDKKSKKENSKNAENSALENKSLTLSDLKVGESAIITSVGGKGALRQHFLDMGVIPGAVATLEKLAPMGDPMEIRIHGYELTLRIADGKKIGIDVPFKKGNEQEKKTADKKEVEHPGYGEGGKYHVRADENPLPQGEIISFALAGNQNSGKTTLFNQLTGSNQHVGNFPGVTVDRKSGKIIGHNDTLVTDLPGIYSLSPYTDEEIVSRQFILDEKPKGIINIVDATTMERGLYLTLQLMELDVPIVLALNMMDEMKGNGGNVDINEMEATLGIPVVPISASKNEGVVELIDHALHVAKYQERPGRIDFCEENDGKGGALHRALHGIMHLIEDHAHDAGIPVRFAASKLIEGDKLTEKALRLTENEKEMIEHIIVQMEEESCMDRAAAIADMRFSFISKVCDKCVTRPKESKERERSRKIDKILTGKWTAIPCFVAIMALVFYLTFNVIGAFLQDLLDMGITALSDLLDGAMTSWGVNDAIHSLVIDGIFGGVGSVLSFAPVIVVMFFFLSLLEDSGYIARVAFFMDKLLRKIGLSGKSIVPMLIGFGCTVPAVMATRTLASERDRKMTIILTPFMSCSAKLPIYVFFCEYFFGDYGWLVMVGLYFLGIALAILLAFLSKIAVFKGEAVPFVMELPNYRLPTPKNTLQLLWEKTKDFIKRAFTIILLATVVIWFLQSFNFHLQLVGEEMGESMLAKIAGWIAPIFKPMGLDDYRVVTALVSGVLAKESVVSTLKMLFSGAVLTEVFSVGACLALLVFSLIYTPCVAAIASIRKELGHKWAIGIVIFQCSFAYVIALLVSLLARVLGAM